MEKLFTNQTGNDVTDDNQIIIKGTELAVQAWGNWGTNTVISIYVAVADNITGVLLSDLTFTGDGFQSLQIPAGCIVWAQLSSAGGGTDINVWIKGQGTD